MSNTTNNISQQALLVSLSFGLPRQSRQLPKEAKKIESDNHAQHGVAKVSIHYFQQEVAGKTNDALFNLKQHFNAWRSEHNRLTRPWDGASTRLLPAKLVPLYMDMKSKFEEATPAIIAEFVETYPDWQITAPQRMGSLYSQDDYPSLDDCRERIEYQVAMLPLPEAEQWRRINLIGPTLIATMETQTNARIAKAVEDATAQTFKDVLEPIQKIVDTLSKDKPRIFTSLIDNLTSVLALVPAFNLNNDADLNRLAEEAKADLAGINADDLREDIEVRKTVCRKAEALMQKFGAFSRKFS